MTVNKRNCVLWRRGDETGEGHKLASAKYFDSGDFGYIRLYIYIYLYIYSFFVK